MPYRVTITQMRYPSHSYLWFVFSDDLIARTSRCTKLSGIPRLALERFPAKEPTQTPCAHRLSPTDPGYSKDVSHHILLVSERQISMSTISTCHCRMHQYPHPYYTDTTYLTLTLQFEKVMNPRYPMCFRVSISLLVALTNVLS